MSLAMGGAFPATRPSVVWDLGSVDPLRPVAILGIIVGYATFTHGTAAAAR